MIDITENINAHHPEIYEYVGDERRLITGKERDAIIATWAANALASAWERIRRDRDTLLTASDWTQNPDAPVDAKAWAAYRQALRDLPATIKDPTADVAWPEPPK